MIQVRSVPRKPQLNGLHDRGCPLHWFQYFSLRFPMLLHAYLFPCKGVAPEQRQIQIDVTYIDVFYDRYTLLSVSMCIVSITS